MPYYIYRLCGLNNKYKNHYIGSTPSPKRRLRQHNGLLAGGAKYTSSKISKLTVINNLRWNFNWLLMTFLDKKLALSLEWHMKHPFNLKPSSRSKSKNTVCFNNTVYNTRGRFVDNLDMMLEQIDITIQYFLEKHNLEFSQIFLLIDNCNIVYQPKNYKVIFIDQINGSIMENNICDYFVGL